MTLPTIQVVDSQEKLLEICKFRYQIYIKELGDTYDGVDEDAGMLHDELDDFGKTMYAEENGQIIGTCRINFGCHGSFDDYWDECYDLSAFPDPQHLSLASKMMIVPKYRGSMLGLSFLLKALHLSKTYKAHFMFLDCIPPLVPLYEMAGFRRYKENSPENKNLKYYIPMVVCIEDLDYFKRIHSPYYEAVKKYPSNSSVVEWFTNAFPPKIGFLKESLIPFPSLLDFVENRVAVSSIPLLRNFSEEEIKFFLQQIVITYCKKGETITFKGDSGSEMYILLEGQVDIGAEERAESSINITVSPGGVFGENNYMLKSHRKVNSVALTDLTVLIINQSFKKIALVSKPGLAAKFYHNLAKIIAQRSLIQASKQKIHG